MEYLHTYTYNTNEVKAYYNGMHIHNNLAKYCSWSFKPFHPIKKKINNTCHKNTEDQ